MRNLIVLVRTNTIDNEYCYHYKSFQHEVPMNIDDGKEGNDDEKVVEEDGILELGIETGNEVGEDVGEEVGEEVVDEQEEGQDGSDLEATALSMLSALYDTEVTFRP